MINISKTGIGIGGNAPSAGLSVSYTNVGVGTTAPSSAGVVIGTSSIPTSIQSTKVGIGTSAPSSDKIVLGSSSMVVNIPATRIGLSTTVSSNDAAGVYIGNGVYPMSNNSYYLGTASTRWADVYVSDINGIAVANYTNNLSFARVSLADITKSSGIGTWTGATGAKANCFVMVMRGNSTTAGSVWYIADAWCSADNTIKFIFQAAGGGSTTPSSGAVNIIWANGN